MGVAIVWLINTVIDLYIWVIIIMAVMSWLLPIFIDIMMDHPEHEWGMPYYPVVD